MLTLPVRLFIACAALGLLVAVVIWSSKATGSHGQPCDHVTYEDETFGLDALEYELDCIDARYGRRSDGLLALGAGLAVGGAAAFVASSQGRRGQ